ncbi:MAG: PHP-associated domain-containing protein [Desulfobacterales bacterium]|jgi:hypothetical protein
MQKFIYKHLSGHHQPEVFAHQVVANEHDHVLGENPRLLIGATELSLMDIGHYPCATSSDAHFLKDIGKVWTEFRVAAPSLKELRLAFEGSGGRHIVN